MRPIEMPYHPVLSGQSQDHRGVLLEVQRAFVGVPDLATAVQHRDRRRTRKYGEQFHEVPMSEGLFSGASDREQARVVDEQGLVDRIVQKRLTRLGGQARQAINPSATAGASSTRA